MKTLLWIDDDERLLASGSYVFEKHGFRVLQATNVTNALTALRESHARIDGVLLDVRLKGGENGLDLLKEILHTYPRLKVAVFTGYPEYDDHLRAERTGALIYLDKVNKSIPLDRQKQTKFFRMLHEVFPFQAPLEGTQKASAEASLPSEQALRLRLLVFLSVFIVIAVTLAVFSKVVPWWALPLVLVACPILFVLVASFILPMPTKDLLALVRESYKQLPLIRRISKDAKPGTGQNQGKRDAGGG